MAKKSRDVKQTQKQTKKKHTHTHKILQGYLGNLKLHDFLLIHIFRMIIGLVLMTVIIASHIESNYVTILTLIVFIIHLIILIIISRIEYTKGVRLFLKGISMSSFTTLRSMVSFGMHSTHSHTHITQTYTHTNQAYPRRSTHMNSISHFSVTANHNNNNNHKNDLAIPLLTANDNTNLQTMKESE